MITAILFDLDGTLINSIPAHVNTLKEVAQRHNIIITDEAFARYNGMSTKKVFRKIMHDHHLYFGAIKMAWELIQARKNIIGKITIFKETKPSLIILQKKYVMAIATSSNRKYLETILPKFGLKQYFQAFLSKNDIQHSKPSPEIFLKAGEELGKEPSECIVIEDSLNGVISGKRAGMTVIAILTSTPKKMFIDEALPDYFIKNLTELTPNIIKKAWSKAHIRKQGEEE